MDDSFKDALITLRQAEEAYLKAKKSRTKDRLEKISNAETRLAQSRRAMSLHRIDEYLEVPSVTRRTGPSKKITT